MRTFHELVVVVLQRRALLSHVCCSTCTQGCMGLHCGGVGLTFVGLGYRAEPRNARRVASRCVLAHAVFCRPATSGKPRLLPCPARRCGGGQGHLTNSSENVRRGGCKIERASENLLVSRSPLKRPLIGLRIPHSRVQPGDTRPRATSFAS